MTGDRTRERRREARSRVILLVTLDVLCVVSSFLAAYWFRLQSGFFLTYLPFQSIHVYALMMVCVLWIFIFAIHRLYRREVYLSVFDQLVGIFNSVNVSGLILLATAFVTKQSLFMERRLVLVVAWGLSIVLLTIVRVVIVRAVFLKNLKRDPFRTRIVVVGAGESGSQFIRLVHHTSARSYEVVGFVDDDPLKQGQKIEETPVLGTVSDLERIVEERQVELVFVAVQTLHEEPMIDLISRCMRAKVPVKMISDQFRVFASDTTISKVGGIPTIGVRENPMQGFPYFIKRLFDFVTTLILIVLLLPIFMLIALLIKAFSPGPVFFQQERAGEKGMPFKFFKFRTMRTDMDDSIHREYATNFIEGREMKMTDASGQTPVYKMTKDPRVTPIGAILRKTSLDELPQLYNVMKGEMSLIGPRPPIVYELQYYKEWHMRRLDAKPGLTGLWQVSGRSQVPFNEMVLLDLYYIDHWSLKLDLEVLFRTIPVILFSKGGY